MSKIDRITLYTASEFVERANYGERLTSGYHYDAAKLARLSPFIRKAYGYWQLCAPSGAVQVYQTGLPVHGPVVCALGAYAE